MNNYTISFINDNKPVMLDNYEHFDSMFEMFLGLIEEAIENEWSLHDAEFRYRGVLVSNDIVNIIKIGTVIANFSVMLSLPNAKSPLMVYQLNTYLNGVKEYSIASEGVMVYIVGNRIKRYNVFPLSILTCNLPDYFKHWGNVVDNTQKQVQSIGTEAKKHTTVCHDHVTNSVLQNDIHLVDMNWTMQYNLHTELKEAIELLDTNPSESKRLLMMMDYMLSKGKN